MFFKFVTSKVTRKIRAAAGGGGRYEKKGRFKA
jgi:hypothetical protein